MMAPFLLSSLFDVCDIFVCFRPESPAAAADAVLGRYAPVITLADGRTDEQPARCDGVGLFLLL